MSRYPVIPDRQTLPPALRLLSDQFPRAGWEAHPNFGGLVQFWMERHIGFRRLLALLTEDGQAMLDRRADPAGYGRRLGRYGSMLLSSLHEHHQIEDRHYFPLLAGLEPRLAAGFEMLEADHQAIDPALSDFADRANAVLRGLDDETVGRDETAGREAVAGVSTEVARLVALLDRHLIDEEELVVPVVLKTGVG